MCNMRKKERNVLLRVHRMRGVAGGSRGMGEEGSQKEIQAQGKLRTKK